MSRVVRETDAADFRHCKKSSQQSSASCRNSPRTEQQVDAFPCSYLVRLPPRTDFAIYAFVGCSPGNSLLFLPHWTKESRPGLNVRSTTLYMNFPSLRIWREFHSRLTCTPI